MLSFTYYFWPKTALRSKRLMILNQLKHNSCSLGTSVSIHVVSTVKASDEISEKTVCFNLLELIQREIEQRNQIAPWPSNLKTGLMTKADLKTIQESSE